MTTIPAPRKVYYASVLYVHDTYIELCLDLGFGRTEYVNVELVGYDQFSLDAKRWLATNLLQKQCVVELFKFDMKVGRYRANLYCDDQFINQRLVDMGFGEPELTT